MLTFDLILPRYSHDCERCRFVGHAGDADCYVCEGEDAVVRRYSDEPADYSSFPIAIARRIPEYASVLAMAAAMPIVAC